MKEDYEFLGLCAIGGEVAFNNELKVKGFSLVEKFPGRLFFKPADAKAKSSSYGKNLATKTKKSKRIIIKRDALDKVSAGSLKSDFKQNRAEINSIKASAETINDKNKNRNASSTEISLFKDIINTNMNLQLADGIGLVVTKFPCSNFDELFEGMRSVNWQKFFYPDSKVVIDKVISNASTLHSVRAVQSVAQKALYQNLCRKWKVNRLEESGDLFKVRVYLENNFAHIVLDLSGEPLYKRGFNPDRGLAPLRETSAANLLQMMHWKRKLPLHDPFCGSGTIPIEATFYAHNVPAGILRDFAFQKFALFNVDQFKEIFTEERTRFLQEIQTGNLVRITGSDIDEQAISMARENAENACKLVEAEMTKIGKNEKLTRPEFVQADVAELSAPYEEGLLLGNPPYGERIGDKAEVYEVYKKLAKVLKNFSHWQKAFITSNPELKEAIKIYNSKTYIKEQILKTGNLDTFVYEIM